MFSSLSGARHHLFINDQVCWSCESPSNGQPFYRVPVVEWPWRNDENKDGGGANQTNVDGKLDVLEDVAHEESDGLREWEASRLEGDGSRARRSERTYPNERQGDIDDELDQLLALKVLRT